MTREEAIDRLKEARAGHKEFLSIETLNKAIKALEHEPILDKVRAEIDRQEKWLMITGYNAYNVDIAFGSIKSALAESEEV